MLVRISIDKNKLPEGKPHQNGAEYLSLDVHIYEDPDKFGNDASVIISQTKEERGAKAPKKFVGNGKLVFRDYGPNQPANRQSQSERPTQSQQPSKYQDDGDDIPF